MPSMRKARSSQKKRRKNMTVERIVQKRRRVVKMNQPCLELVFGVTACSRHGTYDQEESERVEEVGRGSAAERGDDVEAARSKNNTERNPKTTV